MGIVSTIQTQYFYSKENFGNDDLYVVYKKVIYPGDYGTYSYQDWVETFYDEDDARRFLEKVIGQGIHI